MQNLTKKRVNQHDKVKDKYCSDNEILIFRLEIDQYHDDYRNEKMYYNYIEKEIKRFELIT